LENVMSIGPKRADGPKGMAFQLPYSHNPYVGG
jgi:hypothetical protein